LGIDYLISIQNEIPPNKKQYRQTTKMREIGYLGFSSDIDSAKFPSPEWLSDLKVIYGPFPFYSLIHFPTGSSVV
jgi:hypothetical protein